MIPLKQAIHPLDLPEIRTRIASFLCNSDCISCMRVSKDWSKDFAGSVWHTIDFESEDSFLTVIPTVLSKYGHHIRYVTNVVTEKHITSLQHRAITSLEYVRFNISNNKLTLAHFYDLIRRNKQSLKTLYVSAHLVAINTFEEQRQKGIYFSLDALSPGSNLTTIYLNELCLTRDAFSTLLASSPSLQYLNMSAVLIMSYNPSLDHFCHRGLTTLRASCSQVWIPDDLLPDSPSLLVHFPRLESWFVEDNETTQASLSMERMSSDLTVHCPRLKKVCFLCSDPDKIAELLSDAFVRLEHCTFDYNAFNKVTLLGLLEHQETLTTVILSHNHPEIEPNSPDKNPAAKKLIALLLRSCRRLEELSIEGHRMNVVTLENQDWICENLRDLRVRFHGLETEAAVDYCLEQLMARKKGEVANAIDNGGGDSIFDRICLQLFRFKKLKTIWLGTGEYYLATQ